LQKEDKVSGLELVVSGSGVLKNIKAVYGVLDEDGSILSFSENPVQIGSNRFVLSFSKIPTGEVQPYLFLLNKDEVIDEYNTYGQSLKTFKNKFYKKPIKNNNDKNMIYIIYTGIFLFFLGILF
jgi:hypothetical protein